MMFPCNRMKAGQINGEQRKIVGRKGQAALLLRDFSIQIIR